MEHLTDREADIVKGLIQQYMEHANRCDSMSYNTMAGRQKIRDLERVDLLRKVLRVMGTNYE